MARSSTWVEHEYINLDLRRQNEKLGGKSLHHMKPPIGVRASRSGIFWRNLAIKSHLDDKTVVLFGVMRTARFVNHDLIFGRRRTA